MTAAKMIAQMKLNFRPRIVCMPIAGADNGNTALLVHDMQSSALF